MRVTVLVSFALLIAATPLTAQAPTTEPADRPSPTPIVFSVRVEDEPITPVAARYLRRAKEQAEHAQAECLLIELDTPGGLVDSTREIVRDLLGCGVPVVVFVSPQGARAASAGLFLTLAADFAAMAPGTHIGAAHPVQIGGLPIGPPQSPDAPPAGGPEGGAGQPPPVQPGPSATETKVVNDTRAWARALAERHGRNADWAERAVSESLSITASEAVREGVVDLDAIDVADLLTKLDGRRVARLPDHSPLATRNAVVLHIPPWWGERLLGAISDPNVAFLLLMFGFYGILFELYSPGWGVAGTLGIACLVLGCFGLAVLPLNGAGLALIVLALGLFVAEAYVVSFGALTAGGIACLVLGGLMLVDSPTGFLRVSAGVVVPVAVATGLIAAFLVGNIVRAHRAQVRTGTEGMVGEAAEVLEDFTAAAGGFVGTVFVHGEYWRAVSPTPLAARQRVVVRDRKGLTLTVASPPLGGEKEETP